MSGEVNDAVRLARVERLAADWARGLTIDNAHPMEPVSRLLRDLQTALCDCRGGPHGGYTCPACRAEGKG